MNNSWFRLTTAVSLNDRQQPVVRIKHPAPIAPGGWMEAGADETVNVQAKTTGTGSGRSHVEDKSVPSIAQRKDLSVITREELARHNSKYVRGEKGMRKVGGGRATTMFVHQYVYMTHSQPLTKPTARKSQN